MVLLTNNEKIWVAGHRDSFSKGYQRKLKHDIKKKLQQFYQIELPLLIQKGLVSNSNLSVSIGNDVTNAVTTNCNNIVTSNCNVTANCNTILNEESQKNNSNGGILDIHEINKGIASPSSFSSSNSTNRENHNFNMVNRENLKEEKLRWCSSVKHFALSRRRSRVQMVK